MNIKKFPIGGIGNHHNFLLEVELLVFINI